MKMKLLASLMVIIVISDNHVSDAAVTLYQGDDGELVTELWYNDALQHKRNYESREHLPQIIMQDADPLCYNIDLALRMIDGKNSTKLKPTCQFRTDDADKKITVMPIDQDAGSFPMIMIRPSFCHCRDWCYYNDIYIYPRIHESKQYFVFEEYEGCQRVRAIFDSRTEVFSQPRLQPKNSLLNKMCSLLPCSSSKH